MAIQLIPTWEPWVKPKDDVAERRHEFTSGMLRDLRDIYQRKFFVPFRISQSECPYPIDEWIAEAEAREAAQKTAEIAEHAAMYGMEP